MVWKGSVMNQTKVMNQIFIVLLLLIVGIGGYQYVIFKHRLQAVMFEEKQLLDATNYQTMRADQLRGEAVTTYASSLGSANALNQKLVDLENTLAGIEYKKTISGSASEESKYIQQYLALSNQIKALFMDDASKSIASTSFYSGAWDKTKFTWTFAPSYDVHSQTIPVILLCYSTIHQPKELLSYALMDYQVKENQFMNLRVFPTYEGRGFILGTGIESDSEAMQGNLSESERATINRGDEVNQILDRIHQFDLDHPHGVDNPDLDEAIKIKRAYNGLD